MQIFESLNCILCKEPFSRKANQPRSPRTLGCGLAMCHECFEKEKAQKEEDRKHRCNNDDCFYNPNFAYFLIIDVLTEENGLTLLPMERGYALAKPFKMIECLICCEEYSTKITERQPYDLYCNHIICTGCYLKLRVPIEDSDGDTDSDSEEYKYMITCPTCKCDTVTSLEKSKNRLHDFLDELHKMTRQLEVVTNALTCDQCHAKNIIDVMFYCSPCQIQICASCAYLKHRLHDATSLLTKQVAERFVELQKDKENFVKGYEHLLAEWHKGILMAIAAFETKLIARENTLKNASTIADLMEKHQANIKFYTDFEASAERYFPQLRKFQTELESLIDALDKDSDPNVKVD